MTSAPKWAMYIDGYNFYYAIKNELPSTQLHLAFRFTLPVTVRGNWEALPFIPDEEAEAEGLLRVIDESGEDYAFDATRFHRVSLPAPVEKALLAASHS